MIEVGVAFVDVFEEGGAFFFVERLVVGAWEGGVEVVFDGKAEGGACLGAFSPVEDEEGFDTEEEMLGDFFDFVAFGGGKFGGRAGKDVEDDELLLGEVFADMALVFVVKGVGEVEEVLEELFDVEAAVVVVFDKLFEFVFEVGSGPVDLHHDFEARADGSFEGFELGVFVFGFLKAFGEFLEIDGGEVEGVCGGFPDGDAGDGLVEDIADSDEDIPDIGWFWSSFGADDFGDFGDGGDAEGEAGGDGVGLDSAVQLEEESFVEIELVAGFVGGDEPFDGIGDGLNLLHVAPQERFDMVEVDALRGAETGGQFDFGFEVLDELLLVADGVRAV